MKIKDAGYVLTAVYKSQWPLENKPEICLAGRSNVGKSSFINTIANRHNLARVSGKPGKTRTLNYYHLNNELYLVDVPGYGYASLSGKDKILFGQMMEEYFSERKTLKAVILLVDIRHEPTNDDIMMLDYVRYHKIKTVIVATKLDKISKNQRIKHLKMIKEKLNLTEQDIIVPFSSVSKEGLEKMLDLIENLIVENKA